MFAATLPLPHKRRKILSVDLGEEFPSVIRNLSTGREGQVPFPKAQGARVQYVSVSWRERG